MKRAILYLILASLICFPGLAHPGRTDAQGGHWNHKTGEYHFHDGSSAGKSGTSGGSVNHPRLDTSNLVKPTPRPAAINQWLNAHIAPIWHNARIVLLVLLIPVLCIGASSYSKKRKIWKQEEEIRQKEEAERRERWLEERRRIDEIRSRLTKPAYSLAALPIDDDELIVYITRSGIKYHKEDCGVLKHFAFSQYKVGLSTALHHGFSPCSQCCADMPEPDIKRNKH